MTHLRCLSKVLQKYSGWHTTPNQITVKQVFLCVFTQCPKRVEIQPAWVWLCSLCLEPDTSSHCPPGCPFLHSHTSASSLQGAVTFQLSPVSPSLVWHSDTDTDTLSSILSIGPVQKQTLLCSEIIHYAALSWPWANLCKYAFTLLVFERAVFSP